MEPKLSVDSHPELKIENGTAYVLLYRDEAKGPIDDVGEYLRVIISQV